MIFTMQVKNKWEERLLNPRGWRLSKSCYPDEELGFGRRFLYFNGVNVGVSFYDDASLMTEVIKYIRHDGRRNPIVVAERVRLGQIDPWTIKNPVVQKILVKQGVVDINDAFYEYPALHEYILRKKQRDNKKAHMKNTATDLEGNVWTKTEDGWTNADGTLHISRFMLHTRFKSHWEAVEAFMNGEIPLEGIFLYNESALFIVAGLYRQLTWQNVVCPALTGYKADVRAKHEQAVYRENLIIQLRDHVYGLMLRYRHDFVRAAWKEGTDESGYFWSPLNKRAIAEPHYKWDAACYYKYKGLVWNPEIGPDGDFEYIDYDDDSDYRGDINYWAFSIVNIADEIDWFIGKYAQYLTPHECEYLSRLCQYLPKSPTSEFFGGSHCTNEHYRKIQGRETTFDSELNRTLWYKFDHDVIHPLSCEIEWDYCSEAVRRDDLEKDTVAQEILHRLDHLYEMMVNDHAEIRREYNEVKKTFRDVINPILNDPQTRIKFFQMMKDSAGMEKIKDILKTDPLSYNYEHLNRIHEPDTKPYRHWSEVCARFFVATLMRQTPVVEFNWSNVNNDWVPKYATSLHFQQHTEEYYKLLDDVLCGKLSGRLAQMIWTHGCGRGCHNEGKRFAESYLEYHPFYAKKHNFINSAKRTFDEVVDFMRENINSLRRYGFRAESEVWTAFNYGNKRFRLNCDSGEIRYVRYAFSENPMRELCISEEYLKLHRKQEADYQPILDNLGKANRCYYFLQQQRPYGERKMYREEDLAHAISKWLAPPKEYLHKIKAEAETMILNYWATRAKKQGSHLWIDYGDYCTGKRCVQLC